MLNVIFGTNDHLSDIVITGQTRSLKLERRVCSICSSGEVEDEYNFFLKCHVFTDIRVVYINNIMRNNLLL